MAATPEVLFKSELEHFRNEVVDATLAYYMPRTVAILAAGNRTVYSALNQSPVVWMASATAYQNSLFTVLHRVFDQQSPHNINRLLRMAQDNRDDLFGRAAYEARRRGADANADHWLPRFMETFYDVAPDDFRDLRNAIAGQRRVYEAQFRDIRRHYIAHREVNAPAEVEDLFGRARVVDLERLLAYLAALHESLENLFENGVRPVPESRTVDLHALVTVPLDQMRQGQTVQMGVYAVRKCIELIVAGCPAWVRESD